MRMTERSMQCSSVQAPGYWPLEAWTAGLNFGKHLEVRALVSLEGSSGDSWVTFCSILNSLYFELHFNLFDVWVVELGLVEITWLEVQPSLELMVLLLCLLRGWGKNKSWALNTEAFSSEALEQRERCRWLLLMFEHKQFVEPFDLNVLIVGEALYLSALYWICREVTQVNP